MERYIRNEKMLTHEENLSLADRKICVVGCGGLGGYLIEMSARLGIGEITVVDGDVFELSNLNRQLLSDEEVLGRSKSEIAAIRVKKVNSLVTVNIVRERLTEENAHEISRDHDLILDGLDNIASRMILQNTAEELGIPLVHGAISGWYGQVTTIFPGDRSFDIIYPALDGKNDEAGIDSINEMGNPSFTPALVASIQIAEALKVLLGKGDILRHKLLYIDTLNHEYNVLNIR
ncbi:MAG: HesA/MoeB/ThiF family protein [Spirochaetales bacterium]|nr:HesA/MoeB/ThiF family protein [Spirochaetales bacterium]